jgi:hypothetical protein
MNPKNHKFSLEYKPSTKTWSILDDGVFYSGSYDDRKSAIEVIKGIIGPNEKKTRRGALHFFKNWKSQMKNDSRA